MHSTCSREGLAQSTSMCRGSSTEDILIHHLLLKNKDGTLPWLERELPGSYHAPLPPPTPLW